MDGISCSIASCPWSLYEHIRSNVIGATYCEVSRLFCADMVVISSEYIALAYDEIGYHLGCYSMAGTVAGSTYKQLQRIESFSVVYHCVKASCIGWYRPNA